MEAGGFHPNTTCVLCGYALNSIHDAQFLTTSAMDLIFVSRGVTFAGRSIYSRIMEAGGFQPNTACALCGCALNTMFDAGSHFRGAKHIRMERLAEHVDDDLLRRLWKCFLAPIVHLKDVSTATIKCGVCGSIVRGADIIYGGHRHKCEARARPAGARDCFPFAEQPGVQKISVDEFISIVKTSLAAVERQKRAVIMSDSVPKHLRVEAAIAKSTSSGGGVVCSEAHNTALGNFNGIFPAAAALENSMVIRSAGSVSRSDSSKSVHVASTSSINASPAIPLIAPISSSPFATSSSSPPSSATSSSATSSASSPPSSSAASSSSLSSASFSASSAASSSSLSSASFSASSSASVKTPNSGGLKESEDAVVAAVSNFVIDSGVRSTDSNTALSSTLSSSSTVSDTPNPPSNELGHDCRSRTNINSSPSHTAPGAYWYAPAPHIVRNGFANPELTVPAAQRIGKDSTNTQFSPENPYYYTASPYPHPYPYSYPAGYYAPYSAKEPLFRKVSKPTPKRRKAKKAVVHVPNGSFPYERSGFEPNFNAQPYYFTRESYSVGRTEFPWLKPQMPPMHQEFPWRTPPPMPSYGFRSPWSYMAPTSTAKLPSRKRKLSLAPAPLNKKQKHTRASPDNIPAVYNIAAALIEDQESSEVMEVKPSSSISTLLYGMGDMSFARAASKVRPHWNITPTEVMSRERYEAVYASSRTWSLDGAKFGVDATTDSLCSSSAYANIVFNFPYIQKSRRTAPLIENFLRNVAQKATGGATVLLGVGLASHENAINYLYAENIHEMILRVVASERRLELRHVDLYFYKPFMEAGYEHRRSDGELSESLWTQHHPVCYKFRIVDAHEGSESNSSAILVDDALKSHHSEGQRNAVNKSSNSGCGAGTCEDSAMNDDMAVSTGETKSDSLNEMIPSQSAEGKCVPKTYMLDDVQVIEPRVSDTKESRNNALKLPGAYQNRVVMDISDSDDEFTVHSDAKVAASVNVDSDTQTRRREASTEETKCTPSDYDNTGDSADAAPTIPHGKVIDSDVELSAEAVDVTTGRVLPSLPCASLSEHASGARNSRVVIDLS